MKKQIAIVISLLAGVSQASAQELKQFLEKPELETKTVTGMPYSAKAVTTSTQTLADGTKITNTITALLARDSSGRTRREQSMNAVGPWSTNANEHLVYIRDPIAQKMYVIKPIGQSATVVPLVPEQQFQQALEAKLRAEKTYKRATSEAAATKEATDARQAAAIALRQAETKAQIDDLGEQMIEGVRAKGRRESHTIAVGQIGNDHPIQVVSEVWYSDDLQAVVLSKRSDPRIGETEYRLTEISRTEPAQSLFEVPAGYSLGEIKRD